MKKYLLVLAACALTTACAELCEDCVYSEPAVVESCGCHKAPTCGCQKETPCGCHKKSPCGCSAAAPAPIPATPVVLPAAQPRTVVVVVPAKPRAQVVVPEIVYPEPQTVAQDK